MISWTMTICDMVFQQLTKNLTCHWQFWQEMFCIPRHIIPYHQNQNSGSNHTAQLVTKLSKACVEICEGQVDDIKLAENKRIPTESEYIKMVEKKTAVLFEVACAMGAISAKKPAKDM